jgi:hypothetical protein
LRSGFLVARRQRSLPPWWPWSSPASR